MVIFVQVLNIQRLDKYLKESRIIKRRTIANEACDAGRITVNDKVAKASLEVKPGDIIVVTFGNKETKVKVLDTKAPLHKEDAEKMFEYV